MQLETDIQSMETVHSTSVYHIYWHDTEQSILILQFHSKWEWRDVREAAKRVNLTVEQQIESTGQPIYVIGAASANGTILPPDTNSLPHILDLIKIDPSREELSFFVIGNHVLRNLIKIAMNIYDKIVADKQYVFVYSVEEALDIIERHKREHL